MPTVQERRERVVVTGGAGFIGSHVVDALLEGNASEVTVVDNLARGRPENLAARERDPRLNVVRADIRDLDEMRRAFRGATRIFHLAAQSTVMGAAADIDYTFSTNVIGTYNVLKAAAEQGARRVIFTSSREVYGEPVSLPVDESHPLFSINSYGASKVAGEALCRAFARERGLETIVLRLANVYGARDFGRVIPHWIEQARDGRDVVVYGGDQVIDFIWVGDVARALVRAADVGIPLPPINIASGTGTKILDLARRITQLSGSGAEIRVVPRWSIEVMRFVGSTDRMSQLLGVAPAPDSVVSSCRHDSHGGWRGCVTRAPRVLVVVGTDTTRDTTSGPRRDYAASAELLGATILDQRSTQRSLAARMIRSIVGPIPAQAWLAYRRRGEYDAIVTDGEHLGIPLALLLRLSRSAVRHVTIGHRLSAGKKRVFFSLLECTAASTGSPCDSRPHEYDLAVRTLGIEPCRLSLTPYQVDTTFWAPREAPAERLVVSAGLEHRDDATLFRAVNGLDAQVVVGASSNWSRHVFADIPRPANVRVDSFDYTSLRDLYARAALVVVPLTDIDNQAGVTTILEAMAMGKPVVADPVAWPDRRRRGPTASASRRPAAAAA